MQERYFRDQQRQHAMIVVLITLLILAGCSRLSGTSVSVSGTVTTPSADTSPSASPPTTTLPVAPPMQSGGFEVKQIDVGGHRLFIYCVGDGSPTVIMDAGLGSSGRSSWGQVPRGVAKFTRACVYDRAGLGASDSASTPRTSQEIVVDLHNLFPPDIPEDEREQNPTGLAGAAS